MSAVQYIGDDGTTYQLDQPTAYSGSGAGNLPAASGAEPVFPALYVPRYLFSFDMTNPNTPRISVVCNANNPLFKNGPGTTFSISGVGYKVEKCFGEQRPLL